MCGCKRRLALSVRPVILSGNTKQRLTLQVGAHYELRVSADVWVRTDDQQPTEADLRVIPNAPLEFEADVGTITLVNATGTDARAYLRGEPTR